MIAWNPNNVYAWTLGTLQRWYLDTISGFGEHEGRLYTASYANICPGIFHVWFEEVGTQGDYTLHYIVSQSVSQLKFKSRQAAVIFARYKRIKMFEITLKVNDREVPVK